MTFLYITFFEKQCSFLAPINLSHYSVYKNIKIQLLKNK